jgi:hypothetical protein
VVDDVIVTTAGPASAATCSIELDASTSDALRAVGTVEATAAATDAVGVAAAEWAGTPRSAIVAADDAEAATIETARMPPAIAAVRRRGCDGRGGVGGEAASPGCGAGSLA